MEEDGLAVKIEEGGAMWLGFRLKPSTWIVHKMPTTDDIGGFAHFLYESSHSFPLFFSSLPTKPSRYFVFNFKAIKTPPNNHRIHNHFTIIPKILQDFKGYLL